MNELLFSTVAKTVWSAPEDVGKGGRIKSAPFFLSSPPTGAHIRSLSRSFLISRLKPFFFLLSASLLIEHASWEEAEEQDVEAAKR